MNELARARGPQILADLGEVLLSSLDRAETIERLGRTVVANLADLSLVTTLDDLGRRLTTHAYSLDCALAAAVERAPDQIPHLQAVIEAARPVLLAPAGARDGHGSFEYVSWPALDERAPAWKALHVPLSARGRVLGALTLVLTRAERVYGTEALSLAEAVARRAALAIDNACLHAAAAASVRARDEMLGVVAHELRDPLSAILLQTQRARATVEVIHRNATWMNRLVRDLLDVTRFDGGAFTCERGPVSPDLLLTDVAEAMRPSVLDAAIELTVEAESGLPPAWADRDRLFQVLTNLIENALKFTPRGGRVAVAAERADGAVLFSVTDTGIGIAPDEVPRVFDRFWRSREATCRGAGLGLSIAKSLVEAQGGTIHVDSALGRGTTFRFTVPTRRAPGAALEARRA